ncbi:hypothetical protein GGI12_004659 [Dipsacomyces acuminosporus]|nr:hypothetical protein GGI12_004659 [Dipsacomyces acuminosporus]
MADDAEKLSASQASAAAAATTTTISANGASVSDLQGGVNMKTATTATAATTASHIHTESEQSDAGPGTDNSDAEQPTDEYTTDSYTEDDYSDEYTEESVFTDGSGSGNEDVEDIEGEEDEGDKDSQPASASHADTARAAQSIVDDQNRALLQSQRRDTSFSNTYKNSNRRSWLSASDDPNSVGFDTHFSSGTTSPNPVDSLNTTRAANALAPARHFQSHTPWGTSTGRLTRGLRGKGRLWDDPHSVTAANEDLSGPQFAQQRFPTFDEPAAAGLSIDDSAVVANSTASAAAIARGSEHNGSGLHQYQHMQRHHHGSAQVGAFAQHAYARANPQVHHPSSVQNGLASESSANNQAYAHMTMPAQPNGVGSNNGSSTNMHNLQQQIAQMQKQLHNNYYQPQQIMANQVVNVIPVQQGTKNYNQLQQQMLLERKLQQDTIEGKLLQGRRAPRIVTIAQFIKSVSRLLGIGFPSATCTEARLTVALIAVLGVRTGLDVWFANFNARTVRAVVTYDRSTLLRRLLPEYLAMMIPMAAVNQTIKWVISSLTIALRVRLGRYAHERYVDGITNITWNQLHHQGPNGSTPAYERPDWLLTVQIHRFADMLPRLIADVVKPTFDWFVFSRLLSRFISRKGSLTMVLYIVLANVVIRLSSPPVGKHASRLAQLEEKYRVVYARISSIIQRAASSSTPLVFQQQKAAQAQAQVDKTSTIISPDPSPLTTPHDDTDVRPVNGSYDHGQHQAQAQPAPAAFVPRVQATFRQRAKESLDGSLNAVASSVVSTNIRRFFGGVGETILAKYGATLTAYYLLSRPLCSPGRRLASEILHDPAAVMMSYSRNSSYLINLSQATTRLLLMVNDLPKFVWSTVKVDRLLRSLEVHSRYRTEVVDSSSAAANDDGSSYSSS